jgi:site-specific DNA-methyltransferase (adenine-specific)
MKPYYEQDGIVIYHGDCREILPTIDHVDLVFADPPYGVNKAEWDISAPMEWLPMVAEITRVLAVTPGITNILTYPETIGDLRYKWTASIHIVNAIVRGAMGFGNWIPCLIYAQDGESIYTCNQDAVQIAIRGKMPDHPSPKPYDAMRWLLSRLNGEIILDPFMGSGTTLRAAKDLGRKAIGIEIEERYCEIAAKRLQQSVMILN